MRQSQLLTDSELVTAVRTGDQHAFKSLYEKYWSEIYTVVYRRLLDEEAAKDIVQNVFIKLWSTRHPILVQDSLLPYLIAAARNRTINYYKRNQATLKREAGYSQATVEEATPQLLLEAKQLETFLGKEISEMPETMRKTFVLNKIENKSIKDIAGELSLSEQTIKNNISQALSHLRKKTNQFLSKPSNVISLLIFLLTKS